MFGCLLGGKFSNKCKKGVKCTRSRIGLIRKKKQAMLKYLRRDVAELLSNGHENNAFGRIEALIVEINYVSCYDMIELYCECILQLLPSLQKQRECPEEAMEAMSTLIFAAARFSDLPELCDLRTLFTERYGSEMESSTNGEFVEKVQKKSFSMEKKLHLMQHIAEEFSVPWDSKAFQQKLYNQQRPHAENWRNAAIKGRKETIINVGGDREAPSKERWEPPPRNLVQKEQVQPGHRDIHSKLHSENNDQLSAENRRNAAIEGRKEAAIVAGGNRYVPSNDRWEPPPRSLVQKDQVQPEHQDIQPKLRNANSGHHRSHADNWRNAAIKGRKEAATDVGGDREDPSYNRWEPPPRSLVQKEQVQPEPRDIHVIPSTSIGRRHDPAERNRNKVHAAVEASENVDDGKVLPLVKPKGSQNGTSKDVSLNDPTAGNRSPMTREGPGLIGLGKPIVASVTSRDVKAENHVAAIGGKKDPIAQESWRPPKTPNANDFRLINRLPPYTKPSFRSASTADGDVILTSVPINASNPADDNLPNGGDRPKPISDRRTHPKPPLVVENEDLVRKEAGRNYGFNGEEASMKQQPRQVAGEELGGAVVRGQHASRPRRERRRHGSRQSAAAYDRERDEEEQAMDRLLVHFSKRGTRKTRTRTRAPPAELVADANRAGERQHHDDNGNGGACPRQAEQARRRPDRVTSLRSDSTTPVPEVGAGKGPARATSLQPGMLSPREGLVHPNLPDYDELAARFIALRKA
ncbi:Uncharacterized protein M6B38_221720 [Iris pallida]|uniref:IST1-like protein n=1 Tax=Iris pallida TaxID=29817 RepID=A0AAX6DWI4_IRIPA|nr:Uncharacterized protein M6B38_221720 [Iris pallida]